MLHRIGAYVRQHHIGLLALFVALGGTAAAAGSKFVPLNSVASGQVVNGSLQKADLSSAAVKALKGSPGIAGPQGSQGSQGAQGPQGPQGPAGPLADVVRSGLIKLSAGHGMVTVATHGPFTVSLRCTEISAGDYQVEWLIDTAETHSAFAGPLASSGDFGPMTAEADRVFSRSHGTTPTFESGYNSMLSAAAPSGARLNGIVMDGVHTLGADCVGEFDAFTD